MSSTSHHTLQVKVMDWITDDVATQQEAIYALHAMPYIRHLEMLMAGWTIHQEQRIHVGVNSVAGVLDASEYYSHLTQLTVDLECLAQRDAFLTFCSLITTSQTIEKLQIRCSGHEEFSNKTMKELGQALSSLPRVTSLHLIAMDFRRLCIVLSAWNPTIWSYFFPRGFWVFTPWECWKCCLEETISRTSLQELKIERVALTNDVLTMLLLLLQDQTCVKSLVLKDVIMHVSDQDYLQTLLLGQSNLQQLLLDKVRIRAYPSTIINYRMSAAKVSRSNKTYPKLTKVSIGDVMPPREAFREIISASDPVTREPFAVLDDLASALVNNENLEHVVLHGSNLMELYFIKAALTGIQNNIPPTGYGATSILRNLSIQVGGSTTIEYWTPLVRILSHPNCAMECLRLYLARLELNSLQGLIGALRDHNNSLQSLVIAGLGGIDVNVLEAFATIFQPSPALKYFHFDFSGIQINDTVRIFEPIRTLEDVQIGRSQSSECAFFGLRNRVHHLLTDATRQIHRWKDLMDVLLSWFGSDAAKRLQQQVRHEVFLSGLWYAMIEFPVLISELVLLSNEL